MKKASYKMCVTICGRFCPDEGVVAGYDNRIRMKYTAKWGVQIAGMIFQTGSSTKKAPLRFREDPYKYIHISRLNVSVIHLSAGLCPADLFLSVPYKILLQIKEGLHIIQVCSILFPVPARQLRSQSFCVSRHNCRYTYT